jgi:hypothetical protein
MEVVEVSRQEDLFQLFVWLLLGLLCASFSFFIYYLFRY